MLRASQSAAQLTPLIAIWWNGSFHQQHRLQLLGAGWHWGPQVSQRQCNTATMLNMCTTESRRLPPSSASLTYFCPHVLAAVRRRRFASRRWNVGVWYKLFSQMDISAASPGTHYVALSGSDAQRSSEGEKQRSMGGWRLCVKRPVFHFTEFALTHVHSNIFSSPALKKHRITEKAQIKSQCALYLPCLHWRIPLPLVLNVALRVILPSKKENNYRKWGWVERRPVCKITKTCDCLDLISPVECFL